MSFTGDDIKQGLDALLISAGVVLPACLLYVSFRWHERAEEDAPQDHGAHWPGSALDVSAIAPQIRRLRQNHVAALHSRPRRIRNRAELIGAARRMVAGLAYFHGGDGEPEVRNHES